MEDVLMEDLSNVSFTLQKNIEGLMDKSPVSPVMMEEDNSEKVTYNNPTIFCWGNTVNGELGLGGLEEEHVSEPRGLNFSTGGCVKSISCGESHTIFLLDNGTLWSCGSNDHGQLGHDKGRTRPEKVEGLDHSPIVEISAGFAHNLAVDKWGTVFSWGSDSHGQLGVQNEKKEDKLVVVQVAAGYFHSMVLTNAGEIYTCGSNSHGQLGLGYANGPSQTKFCLVEMLIGFPSALITAGGFHSFALSVSGSVYGWGKNSCGQLGVSDTDDKCQPTQLATLRSLGVCYITAGSEHSAFLTQDGGVFTCGSGAYGQLGHGGASNEVLPRKILDFGKCVTQVACGRCHTLCWTNDKLYSFGLNSSGQLGFTSGNKNTPFYVPSLPFVVDCIYAGGDHSMVMVSIHGLPSASVKENGVVQQSCDYRQFGGRQQIMTITNRNITEICSAEEPVNQDLMTIAETVFASPGIWNGSFLMTNNRHIPSTWKNMGVDLYEAEAVLSKLSSNVLLPIFYADRLQSLSSQLVAVVVRWLYFSPKDHVVRLISVYKKTIVSILDDKNQSQNQKDHALKICLSFVSLLNNLNRTFSLLSYHTFAIPQLTSKVDVRLDYFNWLQRKPQTRVFYFCDFPFVFDSQAKTLLLQTDQILQMQTAMKSAMNQSISSLMFSSSADHQEAQYLVLNVSRNNLVNDVLNQIYTLNTHDLKKPLKIKFIGEEAEDAGGVKKEFFLLLIREILDPKYGMFKHFEESRLMWFNEGSFEEDVMYLLIGLLCGLAIYNFTIISLPFPVALYKKLLEEKVDLQDLKELCPTEGRSLEQIQGYKEADFEEVFSLHFEITREEFGEMKTVPLKPGGSNITVTQENKNEFVELYLSYIFHVSCSRGFEAFKQGFQRVCGSTVLQLFHAQELQAMVTGNEDYDWGELERNCTYKGGYKVDDPTIKLFWEVFHEMSLPEKKQFLLFLTGSDRIPILGMKTLKMCIQPTGDERYLPVAHTCFNVLDLPKYQTKERLKYKVLQAIQHNEGFSLV
ncbi:putative E3 ubiquitin-protein ligase HERC4 [Folsomia candida]|uniref:Putative E3 ubiquitin-protein ligase HERC4 n=1 Tax=Folsomia candida TaxID=158441 RepID=A0A226EJQ7_FOLCA|nr:putative E3 ubiquitin-protein ligase HERC4 [Folsomia candida]